MVRDVRSNCDKEIELLSYLFDESSSGDRERIEAHLAECDSCVDEFASLSQARYPVYEWKQLAFDPLPTPEMSIPESRPSILGAFGQYLHLFTPPRSLKITGAFATIAVLAAVGIFVFRNSNVRAPSDSLAAVSDQPESSTAGGKPNVSDAGILDPVTTQSDEGEMTAAAQSVDLTPSTLPAVIKHEQTSRRTSKSRSARARPEVAANRGNSPNKSGTENKPTQPIPKVPVLAQFDEVEDKSLRLAELFEDIESRD